MRLIIGRLLWLFPHRASVYNCVLALPELHQLEFVDHAALRKAPQGPGSARLTLLRRLQVFVAREFGRPNGFAYFVKTIAVSQKSIKSSEVLKSSASVSIAGEAIASAIGQALRTHGEDGEL